MSEQDVLMTKEGLRQKEEELENLKTVRRREVAARIKQAIEFGDISENSEYEDAKNEQAFIEGEILNLEKMLKMPASLMMKMLMLMWSRSTRMLRC